MDSKIVLSIVIPTKNRAELLRSVLASIDKQKADTNSFEVIVMLGERLRRLREKTEYTQQQIANALHIDRSTYT